MTDEAAREAVKRARARIKTRGPRMDRDPYVDLAWKLCDHLESLADAHLALMQERDEAVARLREADELICDQTNQLVEMRKVTLRLRGRDAEQAAEIERLRNALAFAACTIKSGEPWTGTCEQIIGVVFATPEEQEVGDE